MLLIKFVFTLFLLLLLITAGIILLPGMLPDFSDPSFRLFALCMVPLCVYQATKVKRPGEQPPADS